MADKSYLIFSWHNLLYGIEASLVKETFLLPELTAVVEAPNDIVGILNLRSKIVPIMHLDLRLGLPKQECKISDGVIIFAWEELQIGIIVNSVNQIQSIAQEAIEPEIDYGRINEINTAFIAGIAKVDDDVIILLDPRTLVRYPETIEALIEDAANSEIAEANSHGEDNDNGNEPELARSGLQNKLETGTLCSFYELCCPNATLKERRIFQERANSLRQLHESSESSAVGLPLAVIGLNGEYFGLDLATVQEFIDVSGITPIPCCPSHIRGNINLRGEILTLVDIRKALNIPLADVGNISKAVIVKVDDLVAGLPVNEVFNVEYFRPSDVMPVPAAIPSENEAYLRGTVPFLGKILSILDLPQLLSEGGLEVNEEV